MERRGEQPTYKRWVDNGIIHYSETISPGVTIQVRERDDFSEAELFTLEFGVSERVHAEHPQKSQKERQELIFEESAKKAIGKYKAKVIRESFKFY